MSESPYTGVSVAKLSKYKKKCPGPKSKYVRKTFTDLRTTEGRELAEILRELENDLGTLTAGQKIILQSVAAQLSVTRAIYNWINNQESVIQSDGKLLPVLAENYLTYTGALQRSILTLHALAGKKAPRTVDLERYIRSKDSFTSKEFSKKSASPSENEE